MQELIARLKGANANREALIKWAEALKSGKYKQGYNALHRTDGTFCCLGVLCDLAGTKWEPVLTASFFRQSDGSSSYPRESVYREFLGIEGDRAFDALYHLNDDELWSFDQIADLLLEVAG